MAYDLAEIDDVSIGPCNTVMVSVGSRRYILSSIPTSFIWKLEAQASIAQRRSSQEYAALSKIIANHIGEESSFNAENNFLFIKSSSVKKICQPIIFLTETRFLYLYITISFSLYLFTHPGQGELIRLASRMSVFEVALTCALYLASAFVHEFGHSAMCLKATGLAGAITVRMRNGLPVFRSDVSSLQLVGRFDRIKIAAMGPVMQLCFGMMWLNVPRPAAIFGGMLACLAALWSLVPFPGSDGFWLISDGCGCNLPERFRTMQWKEKIRHPYTIFLTTSGAILIIICFHDMNFKNASTCTGLLFSLYFGIVTASYLARFSRFVTCGRTARFCANQSSQERSSL